MDIGIQRWTWRMSLLFIATAMAGSTIFSASSSEQKIRVAVFPFAPKDVSAAEAKALRERWATALGETGTFQVMSQSTMDAVLSEMGFSSLEECTTSACAAYFGKTLGVEAVVQGTIEKSQERYTHSIRLIKVSSGDVLYQRTITEQESLEILLLNHLAPIAQDIARIKLTEETNYRWYAVAGVTAVVGVTIYFISKSLGLFGSDRLHTPGNEDPPPPGGE